MGSQKNNFDVLAAQNLLVEDTHRRKAGSLKVAARAVRQHDPVGGRLFISTQRRNSEAQRRRGLLIKFEQLNKSHSAMEAARLVGVSFTTLWRWKKQFSLRGIAGLLPKTSRCGRRSSFEQTSFTAEAIKEIELLRLEYSICDVWTRFADSPLCPPLVARAVRSLGTAHHSFANVGRIVPVKARVFASADGRRFYLKLSNDLILSAQAIVPLKQIQS